MEGSGASVEAAVLRLYGGLDRGMRRASATLGPWGRLCLASRRQVRRMLFYFAHPPFSERATCRGLLRCRESIVFFALLEEPLVRPGVAAIAFKKAAESDQRVASLPARLQA